MDDVFTSGTKDCVSPKTSWRHWSTLLHIWKKFLKAYIVKDLMCYSKISKCCYNILLLFYYCSNFSLLLLNITLP